ncbi:MAG: His/Gly/Thr/Pro-type tRNA ligase C-terminal domain-containing protein [Patescibacteria group bacterium]
MIRLKDTQYPNTAAFLGNAIRIAEYYGFAPLDSMQRNPAYAGSSNKRGVLPLSKVESEISFARRDERTLLSSARKCMNCLPTQVNLPPASATGPAAPPHSGTLLAWRTLPSTAGIPAVSFELHIVGSTSAVAEALLIVVANAIAEEAGISERALAINNIGSSDSSNRFVRDIGLYLRKHIESISPTLRPRAAVDPLGTLVQLIERGHPAAPRAPQAMEYLTEEERRKFWELLEYLEMFGLPYELNAHILGSRDCWSHSLFEISANDPETGARMPFAFGGRYDPLASRFARTPSSATMVSITCEVRGKTRVKRENRPLGGEAQPAIYFAHLGGEARRRVLGVLENLRRASIPVHQGLWYERIAEQMAAARTLAVPYVLIMGHKEAMEGTILVREVATNSQDAIPLPELSNYLKRRRVGLWKTETHA